MVFAPLAIFEGCLPAVGQEAVDGRMIAANSVERVFASLRFWSLSLELVVGVRSESICLIRYYPKKCRHSECLSRMVVSLHFLLPLLIGIPGSGCLPWKSQFNGRFISAYTGGDGSDLVFAERRIALLTVRDKQCGLNGIKSHSPSAHRSSQAC